MAVTRKARVPMAEQLRLINECRQSGMTDADWRRENGIAVSTFYNWVSRCSFTNNLSENAIRPFAVGRKNWLFSDSVEGANASAVVYTMAEMAKAHDLNIYEYLKFLLDHRPTKEMTDDQLAELAHGIKNSNQKSHVNYSELLQLTKNWGNFYI